MPYVRTSGTAVSSLLAVRAGRGTGQRAPVLWCLAAALATAGGAGGCRRTSGLAALGEGGTILAPEAAGQPGPDAGSEPRPAGARRLGPDLDPSRLPRDPAALPSAVVRWERTTSKGSPPLSPLALWSEGGLVVGLDAESGTVVALSIEDGRELWSLPWSPPPPSTAVAVNSCDDAGRLAAAGAMAESQRLLDCFMLPVLHEGRLYLSGGATLAAVDLRTGKILWETVIDGVPAGRAQAVGDRLVFRTMRQVDRHRVIGDDVSLVAVDLLTGAVAWQRPTSAEAQVAVTTDRVAVFRPAARPGSVAAVAAGTGPSATTVRLFHLQNGREIGRTVVPRTIRFSTMVGGLLVGWVERPRDPGGAVSADGWLVAFQLPELQQVWELPFVRRPVALHALRSDVVVLSEATLRRLGGATGAALAEQDISWLWKSSDKEPRPAGAPVIPPLHFLLPTSDSLLFAVAEGPRRNVMALLDAQSLRPWQVTMLTSPDDDSRLQAMLADDRTLVVGTKWNRRLAAIDLLSSGPPFAERMNYQTRLARLADKIEQDGWVDWSEIEQQLERLALAGAAVHPAAREALASDRPALRLVAAGTLARVPDPAAVPALLASFRWPVPEGESSHLSLWLAGQVLSAIAAARSPAAIDLLGRVLTDASFDTHRLFEHGPPWPTHARWLAMGGLVEIGTPEALAKIDAFRLGLSRRAAPWLPDPRREPAFTADGRFVRCPRDSSRQAQSRWCLASQDRRVVALTSAEHFGPDPELWVLRATGEPKRPLFVDRFRSLCLDLLSVRPIAEGVRIGLRRSDDCCSCGNCGDDAEATEDTPCPAELAPVDEMIDLLWAELERDADGDGWSDREEAVLQTDPAAADTDGDTLADPLDPAPLGGAPRPGAGCSEQAALVAGFFGSVAFNPPAGSVVYLHAEAEDRERLNLHYEGAPQPVFVGNQGLSRTQLGIRIDEINSREGGAAVVELSWRTNPDRGDQQLVEEFVGLKCLRGRWYPWSYRAGWN